jgi:lysophospholipase L1-like esterase
VKQVGSEPKLGEPAKFPQGRWIPALAYLVHLAFPAFLVADVAIASLRREIALWPVNSDAIVGAVSAVWLLAGLGFFFVSRDRRAFLQRVSGPLAAVYAVYVAVFLTEVFLRQLGFTPSIPKAWQPFIRSFNTENPDVTPGVSGPKWFTTNALGIRGPMPPPEGHAYRIVMIGGSTTICANLDDSEEWPHVVMEKMNARSANPRVWTGNAGIGGTNTVHHLALMQWLPGVLRVDMVIFLIGVNDLVATLNFEGAPTQSILEREAEFEGELPPGTHWRSEKLYPLYRRLRLFVLYHMATKNVKLLMHPPSRLPLKQIPPLRKRRLALPVVPLPDLSVGLSEYRSRILALADRCDDLKLRCLFMTQPTMWRDNLTPSEDHLFWTGVVGRFENPRGYVSSAELALGMDAYNRTLLDICQQHGLECFDIASRIPKDTSAFFDEEHFNEAGARLVAQTVTDYLLSKAPFHPKKQ